MYPGSFSLHQTAATVCKGLRVAYKQGVLILKYFVSEKSVIMILHTYYIYQIRVLLSKTGFNLVCTKEGFYLMVRKCIAQISL